MRTPTDGTEALPLAGTPDDGRLRHPPRADANVPLDTSRDALRAVRSFHGGDTVGAEALAAPGDGVLPALLYSFRDPDRVRIDYPLFLCESGADGNERSVLPLADLLRRQLEITAAGADDAKILKDNLPRLERCVRSALTETGVHGGPGAPVDAAPLLEAAGRTMAERLALKPASDEALREDLARLVESIPPGGRFLALGDDATLHLLITVARNAGRARRAVLGDAVRRARTTLRELMRLEKSKDVSASTPDTLRGAMGSTGAARLDTDALARLLGSSRPATAKKSQVEDDLGPVIERNLGVLDAFLAAGPSPLITVIGPDAHATSGDDEVTLQAAEADEVCRVAAEFFDAQAASYAELFAALRTARLLSDGRYDAARHERLRDAFDWSAFSRDEMLALPPVVALESAPHLAGSGMLECSRLLLSGRPVEVLVRVQPATNPGAAADSVTGCRFELAYLGLSHREVLVHQSSAARPDHLMAGFRRSLDAATGSLHVVTSGLGPDGEAARLGAWMHAGAALGGRAHPFIHYDPEAGATWARRLDLDGNPQPEADWPIYELAFDGPDGESALEVAFTFADFVLLEPRFRAHFRLIPEVVPEDELTPLATYLASPPNDEPAGIPFVWAADGAGHAHRLVVDRFLVRACRDRLDYWRTLQELAGIRNEHVREAVDRERARLEEDFAAEREKLQDAQAAEIAHVRQEEARAVLHRLAQSLLGIDVEALAATALAPASAAALAPPSAPPSAPPLAPPLAPPARDPNPTEDVAPAPVEAPAVAAAADDGDEDEEPWIDSALCTSCNDCLDINRQLFVYNANKQAVIGDARAGTFAQLVQAAEKCPARCIHPGHPLNSDEPELDALIERARPFK